MINAEREIMKRLVRIESKLVRGFEELGVNIDKDPNWLTVDDNARTVYISTLGRSMTVLLSDMQRVGATHVGENYEVVHQGDVVAIVKFTPVTFN